MDRTRRGVNITDCSPALPLHRGITTSKPNPTARYLILCDDVLYDTLNPRRVTVVGLLNAIHSSEAKPYPLTYPQVCVFLQVTGCRGPGVGRVEFRHADTDGLVFKARSRQIEFSEDPLEVAGLTFRVRGCRFPEVGLYWVQFWYNQQVVARQPLLLR